MGCCSKAAVRLAENGAGPRNPQQHAPRQQAPPPRQHQQQQASLQQPVRINPQGIYARVIDESDVVVPRSSKYFDVRPLFGPFVMELQFAIPGAHLCASQPQLNL